MLLAQLDGLEQSCEVTWLRVAWSMADGTAAKQGSSAAPQSQKLSHHGYHHVASKHLVAALQMCSDGRLSRGNVIQWYLACNDTVKVTQPLGEAQYG